MPPGPAPRSRWEPRSRGAARDSRGTGDHCDGYGIAVEARGIGEERVEPAPRQAVFVVVTVACSRVAAIRSAAQMMSSSSTNSRSAMPPI
jgi:hypothetical protein